MNNNNELKNAEIVSFIKENKSYLCKKYHLIKIGVFGSFARNEQDINSDIDLIIEFENNTDNIFEIKNELRQYFKDHFKRDVDIAREKYLKPRIKKEIAKETVYA